MSKRARTLATKAFVTALISGVFNGGRTRRQHGAKYFCLCSGKGQVLQRDCGQRLSRLFLCEHGSVREAQQIR
jgi:hypothetical protein